MAKSNKKAKVIRRRNPYRRKPNARKSSHAIIKSEIVTPTVVRGGRERELTQAEIDLVHRTVARGTTPDQFALFLWHCGKHHFDPVAKEVYSVLFNNDKHHQDFECPGLPYCRLPATNIGIWHPGKDMVIMTGIGGLMGLAARSHPDYGSVDAPQFTWFADGRTTPANKRIPESCTVSMWKKGAQRPTSATLFWDEFAPVDLKAEKAKFWNQMPANQLAKCTKAQCTKTAYPDLTDIYVPEEMARRMSMLTPGGREIEISAPAVGEVARARAALRDAKSPEEAKSAQEAFRKAQAGGKPVTTNAAATPQAPASPPHGSRVLGVVTVDAKNWTVTGDLENLSPELQKLLLIRWENEFWHVHPKDVVELERVLQERNYRFQLLTPPSSPPAADHGPSPGGGKRRGDGHRASEPVSSTVTGIVDRVSRELRGNKELGHITLAIDKKRPAFGCWDKDISDILAKNVGKEVTVETVSRAGYSNIVGLVKVGSQTYTDGKIPDVQQKDREPGKTLFP